MYSTSCPQEAEVPVEQPKTKKKKSKKKKKKKKAAKPTIPKFLRT